jgi:DNA modification methylase
MGIPWQTAFALQMDGWILRQDIIWHKPNPMPESVRDRCTRAHEYIFMFVKTKKYFYDIDAIKEPAIFGAPNAPDKIKSPHGQNLAKMKKTDKQRGHSRRHAGFNDRWDKMEKEEQCAGMRNKRSVWRVSPQPFKGAHFATFPPKLIEPCILAGCPKGGTVLDPFFGAGTVGLVAKQHGRKYIGIELNPEYAAIAEKRIGA